MIIGSGLLAKALSTADHDDLIIFAAGVSNSLETEASEFMREKNLLVKTINDNPNKKLIYFSTCSVYDNSRKDTPYVKHKLLMEEEIKNSGVIFIILRVGNAVGPGGNPNTLFNFLKKNIENQTEFQIYTKAKRIFIGVDDIADFVKKYALKISNCTVDLAYPYQYTLNEVVAAIAVDRKTEIFCKSVDFGDYYHVDFGSELQHFFEGISPDDYLRNLISKYY